MTLPGLDTRLTGTQAAAAVGVSKQLLNYWRITGRLHRGEDGRYRYGDVIAVERQMRLSNNSHRLKAS